MRIRYRLTWKHVIIAFLLHASVILLYLKLDDPQRTQIGGLTGDIYKKAGGAEIDTQPIVVNVATGGVADARDIIAQRKARMQQQQEKLDSSKETNKSTATTEKQEESNNNAPTKKTTAIDQQQQEATELERTTEAAVKKAKVNATKKADKEQEKKETSAISKKETKNTETKPTPTKKTTDAQQAVETENKNNAQQAAENEAARRAQDAAQAQKAAEEVLEQIRREKAADAAAEKAASISKGSTKDVTGQGGGDGAERNNYEATDINRYRSQIQAAVKSHFVVPSINASSEKPCRIAVDISREGVLSNPQITEGKNTSLTCQAGIAAIKKTNRVKPPPADIYNEVKYTTLFFKID